MTIYTVKQGDTLEEIAREYGVSAGRIVTDNGISESDSLVPGQTLVLLYPTQTYEVIEGDTLASVAAEFGTTTSALQRNNPELSGTFEITPGQTLIISFDTPPLGDISVYGYAYPYIQESVLRKTLPYLTYLSVFSYGLNPDGSLVEPEDDERLIAAARDYGTTPLLMLTSLTAGGVFSNELVNMILASPELSDRVIANTVDTVQRKGYGGVDMDFEYISEEYADEYISFIERLKASLGEEYTVVVDLAPKTMDDMEGLLYQGHEYAALGDAADKAFLMTYEWGYQYGPPLPVSPIENVRRVIEYAVGEIPREKIYMGIPSYGYDWTLPYVQGESVATPVSALQAVELARREGVDIQYSEADDAPFFNYTDDEGAEHTVWFEDARSVEALSNLVNEYGINGAGIWNIMRWFPQLWLVLNGNYNIRK